MKETIFEICDYYDLLNLHKALLEAKFHLNPDNELVSLSPVIAKISNQIYVKNLISPFIATDEEINIMVEKVNVIHKSS